VGGTLRGTALIPWPPCKGHCLPVCGLRVVGELAPCGGADLISLLRQAHACSHRAQLSGGYDPDGLDELITIAEVLEIEHGWDALLVDQWLERLGLWDQEL
jgi:hypothetical protein